MQISPVIRQKLAALPDKPGCYIMRDRRGVIIYVGKAVSLRKRVRSYFRPSTFRGADPKLRGLIRGTADLDFITVRSDAEAVLTEGRLIKEYRPRYNVDFRDDKRFPLLRVDRRAPWPRFELCRIRREDGCDYFGPYASSAGVRAAFDFVEKKFGLRRCRPRIPAAVDHEHCINDIVRYCSAPCIGKVSPADYGGRVDGACAFLRGEKPEYLAELRLRMKEASDAMDFERAAALRDTYLRLREIIEQKARVMRTPEMKRESARLATRELRLILGLKTTPRVIEAYDISNISGTFAVGGMVCAVDGLPQRSRYRRFRIKTVSGEDDPAMMAEVISRSVAEKNRVGSTLPDLILVDGGVTQLRAARSALDRAGLQDIPVAGLAKTYEEIHRQDDRHPIRLPAGSAALMVLKRIRDEAHRFSLDYHRSLRRRKIRESVIDDIPGVGPDRKIRLLKHFGSVRRLMRATAVEIASVPGIGRTLAESIVGSARWAQLSSVSVRRKSGQTG